MQRHIEPEWLDELAPEDPLAVGSRRDLRRLNTWMGNAGMIVRALRQAFPERPPRHLVDLGAGDGSLMARIAQRLAPDWRDVSVTLIDRQSIVSPALRQAFNQAGWLMKSVQADVFEWLSRKPLEPCNAILANLFLHHFSSAQLQQLFEGCAKNAQAFVAVEPRRSPLALAGSHLVALIGCNAVTRHDAPVSVRAGFADSELSQLWPQHSPWEFHEQPSGLFSHLFIGKMARADVSMR